MSRAKPSRAFTCPSCALRFKPARSDSIYCSNKCRQRAHRARAAHSEIDCEIEAARLRYWQLVYDKAAGEGRTVSQVVTDEAQYVDVDGNVYIGSFGKPMRPAGKTTPHRPGWASWGLEGAGAPWSPPPAERLEGAS